MESGRRHFIMGYDPLGWNIMGYDPLGWGGTLMESGRRNFITGYDPLGWGDTHGIRKKKIYHGIRPFRVGGVIHGIRKRKLYHGTREGVPLGVPQYREARGGERGWQGARGGREGMEMGDKARARGSEEITCYDPLGWGRTLMELGRRDFIMAYNPLRWGGKFMESGRRNFIMGYDPLGWGGAFVESGRGNFIMGHERGWLSPEGVTRGERGARGDGDGRQGESQSQRKF